jgi:hypothetical protein
MFGTNIRFVENHARGRFADVFDGGDRVVCIGVGRERGFDGR